MQVTETLSEGLKRELKVVIPAGDLESKLASKLDEAKDRVQLKGFRPGKVPVAHLRKMYGKSIMAEVIEQTVGEATQKIVEEREEQPAFQPSIKLPEDQTEVEAILSGKADLSFDMAFEILPAFELGDLSTIEIERPVAEVTDEEINEAVDRIAAQNKPFEARGEGEVSQDGDRVTIDFVGSIDGEEFAGGSATDAPLELGSGQFIPGFEEQLVGKKAGEECVVKVTFPEEYGAEHLAGKDAEFAVTVKAVEAPAEITLDDEFAKTLGMESLDALKNAVRQQIESQNGQATRMQVKRQVLDKLDDMHQFELPPSLVEREFEGIWAEVKGDLERSGRTFEDEETTEDEAKADYEKIAERRVRLGLVLAKAGEKAEVQVTDEEMQRALIERARQFPGQEQQVVEHYQKNPGALMELRAPIFEDKVIDYIVELAKVIDKTVTQHELHHHDHDHDHDHHHHDHDHDHDHDHG